MTNTMPIARGLLISSISSHMLSHPSSPFQVRDVCGRKNMSISGLIIRTLAYPFLQGRCLFLASRFAELLPADVRGQYFEAAIQVIESNETEIPFKVSAVKSIQQFVVLSSFKCVCADPI
jgi:hypothetical protein